MKTKTCLMSGVCVVAIALCTLASAQTPRTSSSPSASPKTAASPAGSAAKQGTRPLPFHGMISGVEQTAKTSTTAGTKQSRTCKVTDKDAITKDANTEAGQDIR